MLAEGPVLAVSGTLLVVEFLADKIPGLDSIWDAVHTFIRIPAGALIAMGAFGAADTSGAVAAALLGGTLAGGSHFAKSGSRALINMSPEPFSNWTASFSEEAVALAAIWTALAHPLALFVLLAMLAAAGAWALPRLWRGLRGLAATLRGGRRNG